MHLAQCASNDSVKAQFFNCGFFILQQYLLFVSIKQCYFPGFPRVSIAVWVSVYIE